jgi:hypothetical protein
MTRRTPFGSTIRWQGMLLLAGFLSAIGGAEAESKSRLLLFTAKEASQLRVSDADWKVPPRLRSASNGPRIEIRSPQLKTAGDGPLIETATPANLAVLFQPNGSPVDMASLEITARKGLFSKSLTSVLRPYVHGTALVANDVAIPAGKFLIEIAIADTAGSKTVETYRLQVDE